MSVNPNEIDIPFIPDTLIRVTDLKALNKDTDIGEYKLFPHFLVKIFNIAEQNHQARDFLSKRDFYSADKRERLNIAKTSDFFKFLTKEEQSALTPIKDWNEFLSILREPQNIDFTKIKRIQRIAEQFKILDVHFQKNNFYQLYRQEPLPTDALKKILYETEFQTSLSKITSMYDLYSQYASSQLVKDETASGVCIDVERVEPTEAYEPSSEEDEIEGHWKLHIGIDMEGCGQDKIDIAYNIVLEKMQQLRIHTMKLVAPYINVNSMKGKEFTAYLSGQMIVQLSSEIPNNNIQQFILEVEKEFIQQGIVPRKEKDRANKLITGSDFFSYRNERSRVLEINDNVSAVDLQEAILSQHVKRNYLIGYAIVTHKNNVYFIKNGQIILKDQYPLRKTRDEMEKLDISLQDGDYFPAESAETLAKMIETTASNPFGYHDERFNLKSIDTLSELIKNALHSETFIQRLNDPLVNIIMSKIQLAIKTQMPTLALENQLLSYVKSIPIIRNQAIDHSIREALYTKAFIQRLNDPTATILFSAIEKAMATHMPTLALENQLFNYAYSPEMKSKIFATCVAFFSDHQEYLEKKTNKEKRERTNTQTTDPQKTELLQGYHLHQNKQKKQKLSSEPENPPSQKSEKDPGFN